MVYDTKSFIWKKLCHTALLPVQLVLLLKKWLYYKAYAIMCYALCVTGLLQWQQCLALRDADSNNAHQSRSSLENYKDKFDCNIKIYKKNYSQALCNHYSCSCWKFHVYWVINLLPFVCFQAIWKIFIVWVGITLRFSFVWYEPKPLIFSHIT